MVEVGENYKRTVTEQDAELYGDMRDFLNAALENKSGNYWHMGWEEVGNLSTHLVENYNISPKDE